MRYAHLSPETKEHAVQVLDQPHPGARSQAELTPARHTDGTWSPL